LRGAFATRKNSGVRQEICLRIGVDGPRCEHAQRAFPYVTVHTKPRFGGTWVADSADRRVTLRDVSSTVSKTDPHANLSKQGEGTMLNWAIGFIVIAIIAAILGFGGIAGDAASLAKICFFIFLVLAVGSFIFGRRAI
jgi:uncharacterized membrane protein YtjA (UPF0391 family)